VPNNLVRPGDEPSPVLGLGIRQPDLGQEVCCPELSQHARFDLVGLDAGIWLDADGAGECAFGAVQGGIDGHPGTDSVHFTWEGSDEMDHASGDGDAQLDADGTLTGEIRFHRGDEPAFTAHRW
jgi:hypothetical protein